MAVVTFIAGIVLMLGFHELDLIRSRTSTGAFRKRSRSGGLLLVTVSLILIVIAMMGRLR